MLAVGRYKMSLSRGSFALILLVLFAVTFSIVWISDAPSISMSEQSSVPVSEEQVKYDIEGDENTIEERNIFDTAPIHKPSIHQALMDKQQQSLDEIKVEADTIIADTEAFIQRHELDQEVLSKDEKTALMQRQAQLRERLMALKNSSQPK